MRADGYGRQVPDNEIYDAIDSAIRDADNQHQETRTKAWPEPRHGQVDEIVRSSRLALKELKGVSPVNTASDPATSDLVVNCLFSGDGSCNPLICAAIDEYRSVTKPLSAWLKAKLSQRSFIVPNRMTKLEGINKNGKPSTRCRDNTGSREYLVVECDFSKFNKDGRNPTLWKPWIEGWEEAGLSVDDACASILLHLHQFAPLVLAVHSGGKSLHGWFPCRGVKESVLKLFMDYAVVNGADPKTWGPEQLVRMPGGTRANGNRQEVLFYDPDTIKKWRDCASRP
jgi:hypothetical protein